MSFDPTYAVEQIRETRKRISDAVDEYWADPKNDEDPGACGDHYDALSDMYEDIANFACSLDYHLSTGGELPEQWRTGVHSAT
ncbi:MAG: hypothetical protein EON54_22870 [Alcaligenaceae bacterium]|nr:MAG: hypothetical protein EON54_22870 [Alcaligenaceae bacterium]